MMIEQEHLYSHDKCKYDRGEKVEKMNKLIYFCKYEKNDFARKSKNLAKCR